MSKLYSQKRTPTANAGPLVQQIQSQVSQNINMKVGSASKSKDRQPQGLKMVALTQDNWNSAHNPPTGLEISKILESN